MTALDVVTAERNQGSDDDPALRNSKAELAGPLVGEGQTDLTDLLTRLAHFAVNAVRGADGAGVTLPEAGRPDTIVSTTDFVDDVDLIQYALGQGPCITAAATGRTVRSGSLTADQAWPRFRARAARFGVHSALSVPLHGENAVVGTINMYAHSYDAFDERAVELAELFARPAAVSVRNAQAVRQAQRLGAQLQTALADRVVIDQAVGILRGRIGCTAAQAVDKLHTLSQAENLTLHTTAENVVTQAVRRAHARATTSTPTPTPR